jgi:hypothetical protein
VSPKRVHQHWLYLFSSNQSPQYVQDVVNVLASPEGAHYTFRYGHEHLTPFTRDQWLALKPTETDLGARVLVIFSIQQTAKFVAPVFLPVRFGHVVATDVVGTRYYVTFRVDDPAALTMSDEDRLAHRHHEAVSAFTAMVVEHTTAPYTASASLGKPFSADDMVRGHLGSFCDHDIGFERAVDFLGRTESFADFTFFRLRRVVETHSDQVAELDDAGTLILRAGRSYDLQIVQSQVVSPTAPRDFEVETDGTALMVVGVAGFRVASRYDRPVVALHAVSPPNPLDERQTLLNVHPGSGVSGPYVAVPVRVTPDKGRAIGVAVLQTLALFAVALAGVLSAWPLEARLFLALAGALGAALLQLFGVSALRALSLPSSKANSPTPGAGSDEDKGVGSLGSALRS